MCFKFYLTNLSIRAALFGQLSADAEAMGATTETAIFSQWQHNKITDLYYARWNSGEVDIVHSDKVNQLPSWIVEVKWSDRPYRSHSELDNCVEFVEKNPKTSQPILVTSRTITDNNVEYKGVKFEFRPASFYAYLLGANLLRSI
jgi:hypothetical protein